jgi:iron complex transport system permease protein
MNMAIKHPPRTLLQELSRGRLVRLRHRNFTLALLAILVISLFALSLMIGRNFVPLPQIVQILFGAEVEGANFAVERLRLPRALLSLGVGLSFGIAGIAFQTMLRNPLASPDIIGINAGASAAAVFAIVVLSLGGIQISILAIGFSLIIAVIIYLLAFKDGVVGARIILVGIGIAAMLDSAIAYMLSQALVWDLQEAMRWLTGSVNGAKLSHSIPVYLSLLIFGTMLLSQSRHLEMLRLGDDAASALGVRVELTRIIVTISAVGLIAFATAAAGPVAFVAFLSGPIAARLVGLNGSLLVPAALVGASLVLGADLIGQNAFTNRYPVGVITGALGAPFLIFLTIRATRSGGKI